MNRVLDAVLLFCLVFIVDFWGCKVSSSFDSRWAIHTTMSLLKEGNLDLDEYQQLIEAEQYYGVYRINGHLYNVYPPGASLLALPYVAFMETFYKRTLALNLAEYIGIHFPRGLEIFIASQFVAFTAVLIYLIGMLFLEQRRAALLLAGIFAFGTSAWSTASRALWQHGPSALMLALALYLFLLAQKYPRYAVFCIPLASLPLAFSFIIRPTNSVPILLLTLLIAAQYRKSLLWYGLGCVGVLAPFGLWNLAVYHALLPPYYLAGSQLRFHLGLVEGLLGTLFSPSRGLFTFTPILLLAVYGIILKIRQRRMKFLDYTLLTLLVCHWALTSAHPHWWGGHSYGPRYFTDVLPYFIYFLIPVLEELLRRNNRQKPGLAICFGGLLLISVLIHWRGATNWDVHYWNTIPVNVDDQPSRVWDWGDLQFLRGLP